MNEKNGVSLFREMSDYSKGKIYAIKSKNTDEIYIGSSIQILPKRYQGHNWKFRLYLEGKHHWISSFDILKHGDCYIELFEDFPCTTKIQLLKREGELIKSMDCVNKNVPGRSKQECDKIYRDSHKEERKKYDIANKDHQEELRKTNHEAISISQKKYVLNNLDKIKERQKMYKEDKKEQISIYNKAYGIANKDKIYKRRKELVEEKKESLLLANAIPAINP